MATDSPVGAWVKRRRRSLALTQNELARRANYSVVTVRKIESGELRPSKMLAERLAEALGIPAEQRAGFVRFARQEPAAQAPPLPDVAPALAAASLPGSLPSNLPVPLTSLIGRDRELSDLTDLLLRSPVRLVTLTGAGGTGKTRLALEAARRIYAARAAGDGPARPAFDGGIFFVNLAALCDPALVISAIAQSLDLRQQDDRPLSEVLKRAVRDRRVLLVLDNFEHLVEAAPQVAELLAASSALKVLVTSRRPLRVHGETEYPVSPLPSPDRAPAMTAERLLQNAASQLFVRRAREVRPDFVAAGDEAPAVAEICRRLDGLPLAIELAAARVKVFPPRALLRRMEQRLPMLADGPRDVPTRQRTMRSAIAWSYDLLRPDERRLFARLAIFAGGFTCEAAAAVCNAGAMPSGSVVDGLSALVDHSLLQAETRQSEPRFVMLQTLQEYALERLEESGEPELVRRAHARFYLDLTAGIDPKGRGPELAANFKLLEADQDNLRGALRWCFSTGEREWGLRLAARLAGLWEFFGDIDEGRQWLAAALAVPSELAGPAARADVLFGSGVLAMRQGASEAAGRCLSDSLALWQSLDDPAGVAHACLYLGNLALESGDLDQAAENYRASLALFRGLGDRAGAGLALSNLGLAAGFKGSLAEGRVFLAEAAAIFAAIGSQFNLCLAWVGLGWTALLSGDPDEACKYLRPSALQLGDLGERLFLIYSLIGLAGAALVQQQPDRASRLLAVAETLRAGQNTRLLPLVAHSFADLVARTRASLPAEDFALGWQEGCEMSLAQALVLAACSTS